MCSLLAETCGKCLRIVTLDISERKFKWCTMGQVGTDNPEGEIIRLGSSKHCVVVVAPVSNPRWPLRMQTDNDALRLFH